MDPTGRLVSEHGWSIPVDPLLAPTLVLSDTGVVYIGKQGELVRDCSN